MRYIALCFLMLFCATPLRAEETIAMQRVEDPGLVDYMSNKEYLGGKFEIYLGLYFKKQRITFCNNNPSACGKEKMYFYVGSDGEYPEMSIFMTPPAEAWEVAGWTGWVGDYRGHYSVQLKSVGLNSNGRGGAASERVHNATANLEEATLTIAGEKTQLQRVQDESRVHFLNNAGERGRVLDSAQEIVIWRYHSDYHVCYPEWNNYANDNCGKYQLYLALTGTGPDPARILYISPETYGWTYQGVTRKVETNREDDFTILEFEERYLAHNGTKPVGWRTRPWELHVNQWKAFLREKSD